ncbi:hypothetical protein J7E25_08635 [Agromyces sp. ISL-38]|uniref:hypothetical protein n=1 Tax=Agromyces sp. ISL-38 TaxID=2819107 RepID=UPI001BE6F632|nr:hypothetical protein [Agromyces sp. ISL-38]MBT2499161.1 hypothetical protein [Agromyces sp. ISL-38]MBT2518294.1 hypothetical protein [Streptomyces sp. ISL-90]
MHSAIRLIVPAAAAVALALVAAPPAQAAPSCVAQSIPAEHQSYGPAWGHDLISFLATNPEVLEEFGFRSFGDYASFVATLDRTVCPPDL